jgi:hypothetical protein
MSDRSYTLFELHLHDASLEIGGPSGAESAERTTEEDDDTTTADDETPASGGSPLKALVAMAAFVAVVVGLRRKLGRAGPAEDGTHDEADPEDVPADD